MKKAPGYLAARIEDIVATTPVDDIHTHLYALLSAIFCSGA